MAKSLKNVAKDLRASATGLLRSQLRTYKGDLDDLDTDMVKMFREDCADTFKVAGFIEAGRIPRAMEFMGDMDTAARDEVGIAIHKKSKGFYNKYLEPDGWCI